MNEAANEGWSARTLDRNIGTQYYYRLLQSPQKEKVIEEMQQQQNIRKCVEMQASGKYGYYR